MEQNNMVIGVEGLVGAGKTSICRRLLTQIPNSILLHGGNIYRAIVYAIMQSGMDLTNLNAGLKDIDMFSLMKKLGIEVRIENRETVIYINNVLVKEEDLQSDSASIAVSNVSNVADNTKLYAFGKKLIDNFREKYHIILSSRDIMKMYPETNYHFFITAELEERVNRKFMQYNGDIPKEQLRKNIMQRDILQEKSGYYKIYPITEKIDVTDCNTIEEATQKLLTKIKMPMEV